MILTVYKGFDIKFLENLEKRPLISEDISKKKNVLKFNKEKGKKLNIALMSLEDTDNVWITYEEYSFIKKSIDNAIEDYDLQVCIIRNNLFPDYYPIEIKMDKELVKEIMDIFNGERYSEPSEDCGHFTAIYDSLIEAEGVLYGSFRNFEYDNNDKITIEDFYPQKKIENSNEQNEKNEEIEYNIFLNDDIATYLRDLAKISKAQPKIITLKSTNGETSKRIQRSLQAYCSLNGIRLMNSYNERIPENLVLEEELINIAKNDIKIENFESFRLVKFYKNPDINKDVIMLSQSQIINEIIHQAENSYDKSRSFRDIFITASTGAGKSVMFQVPAVYLAKKYNKLTIIIEPVKALMQDQKDKLYKTGFKRVEVFNSDLITQVEKERVLQRIKNGEVDLLYLSPETLLSYSIETIIGNRDIGLIIVDEAHIVTTWGIDFRPDYWYLGSYLNKLRNKINIATTRDKDRKIYQFPICAFTATAINGGIDDSVSDIIISLYMENPIKYLGYVRRDDINFEITHPGTGLKLPTTQYEEEKCKSLNKRINNWLSTGEKTIVYFPYASLVSDASKGVRGFVGITTDTKRIGTYTGKNIYNQSTEDFTRTKMQIFENFRNGITPIMLATKAFGMGVDVNDVKNIYHYAVSGNLSDYVQEIGRAARKISMTGKAITDFYYNDMKFMKILFRISQIKQYQVKKVLEGIYNTYKSKNGRRNFLISPESFTYIFKGNEKECINKLKICLLMLEKDFRDKYNVNVLIARPQSIFTKTFICINKDSEKEVLASEFGDYMERIANGRFQEIQRNGDTFSDMGDIYKLDLKSIWENFHPNISFSHFKYLFFNADSNFDSQKSIMSSIRSKIAPRQKITIIAKGDFLLSDLQEKILQDFEYIADSLYSTFKKQYFTLEDFAKIIRDKYGITKARMIANSLFDLVDPNNRCIKYKNGEYALGNGNFKELMRRPIIKSEIIYYISKTIKSFKYDQYISLMSDKNSITALKLLSIFDYITYEVAGGEEPAIFIRLNDPNRIQSIVMGNMSYSNSYVTKATQKHERDIAILLRFFNEIETDKERWDYIENYFLGNDVLVGRELSQNIVKMSRAIDKEHSYQTSMYNEWSNLESLFDESDHSILLQLKEIGIPIPEYLETAIKKSDEGEYIIMSWPSKDTLICSQDTSDTILNHFSRKGWHSYRMHDIDYNEIKNFLS